MKKLLSLLCALALLLTMVPLTVWAEASEKWQKESDWSIPVQVNPLYADVVDPLELEAEFASRPTFHAPDDPEYVSEAEAADQIRENMKQRKESFTVCIKTTRKDAVSIITDAFYAAFEHTGNPTEGDYLMWHYGGWGVNNYDHYTSGGYTYMSVPFQLSYYTTASQEAELEAMVDAQLQSWKITGASDYDKISLVYDFITEHVEYDYEHLSDDSYFLQYTAYAAMINGTSVCQGYANLFYCMMLKLGVDNRIVVGDANGPHAWNLVKVGEAYYYLDATWDSGYKQAGLTYSHFLRGSDWFDQQYTPDPNEASFLSDYPISRVDYPGCEVGIPDEPDVPDEPDEPDEPYVPDIPEVPCDPLASEWELLALVNRARHQNGLNPLTTTTLMIRGADIRADEITEVYDHTRPDDTGFYTVFYELGFDDLYSAGENIASGQPTAQDVFQDWMNSPAHRDNILSPATQHMGAGFAHTDDAYGEYWVQIFATGLWCTPVTLELNQESVQLEKGASLEDLNLWATVGCSQCGKSYLPILPEYCQGFSPDKGGVQTVTVSVFGLTDTLQIEVLGTEEEQEPKPEPNPTCGGGDDTVYATLIALKKDYPEGMPWDDSNSYKWNINNTMGYGCAGFAFLLSDAAFGHLPSRTVTEDITIDDLRVGDILRVYGDSHSVVVLEVYEDFIVLAEGNYNYSIHWGRTMTAQEVAEDTDYFITRYPEHSFANGVCTECGAQDDGHMPGDINGDGKVNSRDATRLFQFLAGWEVEVDKDALDVNGDGKVNSRDATRLFQFLAGWEVELH